jgi:hypothetical protein
VRVSEISHLPAGPHFVGEGGVAERPDELACQVELDAAQPLAQCKCPRPLPQIEGIDTPVVVPASGHHHMVRTSSAGAHA